MPLLSRPHSGTATAGLSFLNSSNPPSGNNPWGSATGDFNGDGIPDLAVTNNTDGTISIFLGKGDGTFTPAPNSPIAATYSAKYIVVGDFNGDGKADLATQGANYQNVITVLLGNGDGTFAHPTKQVIPVSAQYNPGALAAGDFNGDGISDLAVTIWTNNDEPYGDSDFVMILLGNGDGTFTPSANVQLAIKDAPFSVSTGDFNRDGISDLAAVNYRSNSMSILLGNGDGTFTQAANSPIAVGSYPISVEPGDFNQDGIPDLAVVNSNYTTSVTGSVTVLLGSGDGTFTPASNSPITVGILPSCVRIGDFNGDGKADMAVANADSYTVTILLGGGNGTFTLAKNSPVNVGVNPESVAVADFNGDGISDFATANVSDTTDTVVLSQITETATATMTGVSPLGAGTHQVEASYPGDSDYGSSVSGTVGLTAQTGTATVNVTAMPASITTTQTLTVTVNVVGVNGVTPTGSVTLTSGSYSAAAATLSSGSATIGIPAGSLGTGTDTLKVSYTGDANYAAASGQASVTVTNPSFTMSSTAVTIATLGATTGNTSTITVTPAGGFTGSVTLTASITSSPTGAVDLPTLGFGSSSPVTITGASAGTATLTIATTAVTSSVLPYPMPRGRGWYATGG